MLQLSDHNHFHKDSLTTTIIFLQELGKEVSSFLVGILGLSSEDDSVLYRSAATTLPQVKGTSSNSTRDGFVSASVLSLAAALGEGQNLSPHNPLGELLGDDKTQL